MSIYFYVLYNARDMHGSGNGIGNRLRGIYGLKRRSEYSTRIRVKTRSSRESRRTRRGCSWAGPDRIELSHFQIRPGTYPAQAQAISFMPNSAHLINRVGLAKYTRAFDFYHLIQT